MGSNTPAAAAVHASHLSIVSSALPPPRPLVATNSSHQGVPAVTAATPPSHQQRFILLQFPSQALADMLSSRTP